MAAAIATVLYAGLATIGFIVCLLIVLWVLAGFFWGMPK